MSKKVYQIVSIIVVFALTFGSYVSAGASSAPVPQMAVTTYYVSTSGNDANAGTSSAPFKTIQKCANVASSGNVCSVAAGTYAERVSVTRIGIVFQANGLVTMQGFQISADNVSVKGFYITGMASTFVGISVAAKGCVIENNRVYYAPRGGIQLTSTSSGCVVRNNKLEKNSQWGVSVDGTNNVIDGNEVWATIQYHPQWTNPPSWVDADGMRFFGTGHIFRNNYIHDIKFDSVYNKTPHIDCFQTWTANTANILFEGNRCNEMYIHQEASGTYMKAQGFMIEGGAHDITIRNNILNAYRSINLGDSGDATTTKNIFILNNTFVGAISIQLGMDEYGVFVTKATAVTVKNNIFYNVLGHEIYGTVTAGYNLHYRGDGKSLWDSPAPNDLWGVDPLLTTDYHLTANSPARGKAEGGGDMGAFPYAGASPTVTATATLAKTSTPTATSVPASATPTASSIPASATPTASSVPASATPVASTVPASPTLTASPVPASATPTATPVPALPTSTARPTIQPTNTQEVNRLASEKVFDDKNSSFVFSPGWQDVSNKKAYDGSYKQTIVNDSFATFTFTGQSFSVLYSSGPALRKIDVYVDGLLVGTIDEKGKSSFQKRWDYPGQLTLGSHTLKLVFVNTSTSTNICGSIDAVIVR